MVQDPAKEETMYFNDGVRRIDYVLAYEPGTTADKENRRAKREYFQKELEKEGLQLEFEAAEVWLHALNRFLLV